MSAECVERVECTCAIERCHGEHGFLIGLFNFLFGDNEFDLVPPLRLVRQRRDKQERGEGDET